MIVVKVPGVNGLGKTEGTRNAGNEMIKGFQIEKLEEIHVDNGNLPEQEELILKNARKLFGDEGRVVFLGGDHSISYPLGKSFFERFPNGRMIVFDAHADCMKPMKEPTHEEWLRALVESGVDGEKIMIVGLNKVESEEKRFMEEQGIRVGELGDVEEFVGRKVSSFSPAPLKLSHKPCKGDGIHTLDGNVEEGEGCPLYVSFDIDVLEKVKATGYPEGKLGEEEVMKVLEIVSKSNWKGFDLVEVNLEKEGLDETLGLARKVLEKYLK